MLESLGLCKYKDIFGRPNEGGHSFRIFNIAIIDVVFTIIGGVLIARWLGIAIWKPVMVLFILGIFFHRLFCVRTTVDKLLFPNAK
jgi:hypothetical protein